MHGQSYIPCHPFFQTGSSIFLLIAKDCTKATIQMFQVVDPPFLIVSEIINVGISQEESRGKQVCPIILRIVDTSSN